MVLDSQRIKLRLQNKHRKMGQESTKVPSEEPSHMIPFAMVLLSENARVQLKVKVESDEWIKDSGYSRHMTGNKDLFCTYEAING
ncbi:hypothetical protein Tco_0197284, partial [Tanacetum coccineum]